MDRELSVSFASGLASVEAGDWDRLHDGSNPFIRHAFLLAMEQHDCLHRWGWEPHHLLAYRDGELVGACPAYIKHNSYGEFVFDWAWADAYQRSGLEYYPKLVCAIPYTPATGPRLLATGGDRNVKRALASAAISSAGNRGLSSVHWLFLDTADRAVFDDLPVLRRRDVQFHWHNRGYRDFDDYLSRFTAKKRKNIRQERRRVNAAGIDTCVIPGSELTDAHWRTLYDFYRLTFDSKFGTPTLTENFFRAVAEPLRAIFAVRNREIIAGAICFQQGDALYGRHWGCYEDVDKLHFEVCYYSGIEYCIRNGLRLFEPGAQGEHKLSRGFLPARTHSAHWVAHDGFRAALQRHLQHESAAVDAYYDELDRGSPFRAAAAAEPVSE